MRFFNLGNKLIAQLTKKLKKKEKSNPSNNLVVIRKVKENMNALLNANHPTPCLDTFNKCLDLNDKPIGQLPDEK